MKQRVKVYAVNNDLECRKWGPEISCISDTGPKWVEVCWGVTDEESNKTSLDEEYIVIVRKPRWYDRFI